MKDPLVQIGVLKGHSKGESNQAKTTYRTCVAWNVPTVHTLDFSVVYSIVTMAVVYSRAFIGGETVKYCQHLALFLQTTQAKTLYSIRGRFSQGCIQYRVRGCKLYYRNRTWNCIKTAWWPHNKFRAQLLDSLGPASNLEKIICAQFGPSCLLYFDILHIYQVQRSCLNCLYDQHVQCNNH